MFTNCCVHARQIQSCSKYSNFPQLYFVHSLTKCPLPLCVNINTRTGVLHFQRVCNIVHLFYSVSWSSKGPDRTWIRSAISKCEIHRQVFECNTEQLILIYKYNFFALHNQRMAEFLQDLWFTFVNFVNAWKRNYCCTVFCCFFICHFKWMTGLCQVEKVKQECLASLLICKEFAFGLNQSTLLFH